MSKELPETAVNQWRLDDCGTHSLPNVFAIGKYKCCYTNNTSLQISESALCQVAIIGTCVDATGAWEANKITAHLCCLGFDEFISSIDNLCGVYVIFRKEAGGPLRIFGDATHMMSVYFGISGASRGVVASCETLIIENHEQISETAKEILAYGASGQKELVNDLTMYDNVRCLLPNHYLDVDSLTSIRYFPREILKPVAKECEIDAIVETSLEMIINVVQQFSSQFRFASPLTQGADSRVNCALLHTQLLDNITVYYLLLNHEMTKCPRNVGFIEGIAKRMGLNEFRILPEEKGISANDLNLLESKCGKIRTWGDKIWTYHPSLVGRAIVNGQIIGQIGKASMGEGRPEFLARYFLWIRQGLVSNIAHKQFLKWYDEAKANARGYSLYDLWGWEQRCGRWNANLISMNSIMGILDVNFYNCRRVLCEWCRVPRKQREQKVIHIKMLRKLTPELAGMPFNPYWMPSKHLPPCLNKAINIALPGYFQQLYNYWSRKIKYFLH